MSYDTTAQALASHFEKEIGAKPSVRLLTTKPTPATRFHKAAESRSRGIAFVEFPTSGALQAGLKLHHTELDGKKINVELTAGGGGATEERKKKIQERNERVVEQRKRKRDADGGDEAEGQENGEDAAGEGEEGSDKKKVRGGRRGKKVGRICATRSTSTNRFRYRRLTLTDQNSRRKTTRNSPAGPHARPEHLQPREKVHRREVSVAGEVETAEGVVVVVGVEDHAEDVVVAAEAIDESGSRQARMRWSLVNWRVFVRCIVSLWFFSLWMRLFCLRGRSD